MYQKKNLKNGLRVILVPQKDTQAMTILIMVATGARYETKKTSGVSHFLEHTLFKGSKNRPSWKEINEELDKLGGEHNAFTGYECTGYWVKSEASHFDSALDILSDIFLNPIMPEKDIEKEKGVIIEEINMYFDNPSFYILELWRELLYGDQSAGRNIAGTKESVKNINRIKLLDYFKKQYTASNSLVCVAGKIKPQKVFKKIEKVFSGMVNTAHFIEFPIVDKQKKPGCLLQHRETNQTQICLGVRGYDLFHPKKYVYEALGVLLGGMLSSRLVDKVRHELGAVYSIHTSSSSERDCGYLATFAGVDSQKAEKAISLIIEEYKKISIELVSEDELNKVKNYIKGRLALNLESSDAKALFFAEQELLEKKILTPDEIFAKIDAVKSKDIMKVAKEIFQTNRLNLALIGPFNNKKQFQKLLKF